MTRRTMAIMAALTVLAMLASGAAAALSTPDGLQLPMHWGLDGKADRIGGKWPALLAPGALMALISLLFYFLPSLEPRARNLERSRGLYLRGWASVLIICASIQIAVLSAALGWGLRVNHLVVGALGIAFAVIGNQLGKSRRMYMIGIRTPWTLASEEVWIRTHRLGGKLMVAGGLLLFAAALLPLPSGLLGTLLIAVISVAAAVPVVFSYFAWRREKAEAQPSP